MGDFVYVPGVGRIYKRGKVWYKDYRDNGIRYRKKSGGSKEIALQELVAETTDIKRGNLGFIDKNKQAARSFSDVAEEYLQIKATGPKPRRSIRCIRGYVKHLKDFFGEIPLARITPELIEEYQKKRSGDDLGTFKKEEGRRKVKGQTINRELAHLRNLFNLARKKKLFQGDNPVSDIEFFPEPQRSHYILTSKEYSELVRAADPRLRPIIQVAAQTGLRKNDILCLKRRDIDFKRNTLRAWVSKTQEWQTFVIGQDLASTLKEIPDTGEHIFTNPKTGTRWKDIKRWWKAALKEIKLDKPGLLIFHDLRANAGIRAEEKEGPYAAQRLLNHKDFRTTVGYLDLPPERALAVSKALDDFFKVTPDTADTRGAQDQDGRIQTPSKLAH